MRRLLLATVLGGWALLPACAPMMTTLMPAELPKRGAGVHLGAGFEVSGTLPGNVRDLTEQAQDLSAQVEAGETLNEDAIGDLAAGIAALFAAAPIGMSARVDAALRVSERPAVAAELRLSESAMRLGARWQFLFAEEAGIDGSGPGLSERLRQVERSLLIEALRRNRGAATQAARELKLPRKTFYDKLARHGIRPEQFRG